MTAISSSGCFLSLLALIVSTALGGPLQGQSGMGNGIATPGSPHNFVDNIGHAELPALGGWNFREELCRVCHVPHDHDRATLYGTNGLLWNHQVSTATYVMYSSATLDGATASQPTGFSKMCLGCHDGTVAIDTFDKYAGGTVFMEDYNLNFIVPGNSFAGDLTSTHPISIVYDENLDPNLHAKTDPMGGSGSIEDVLEGGSVLQCSTCHDVHDQPGEAVAGTALLRAPMSVFHGQPSGLCLTCHIK
ncbi:MAG: cytochrome C [Planctomycetes bacterium]|nr:cytochrome C [Planctomycetota bacterium]